jgi:hypothetical protein
MTTFNDICRLVKDTEASSLLLKQACALPRSAADMQALPDASSEAHFDSAWEVVSQAVGIDADRSPRIN